MFLVTGRALDGMLFSSDPGGHSRADRQVPLQAGVESPSSAPKVPLGHSSCWRLVLPARHQKPREHGPEQFCKRTGGGNKDGERDVKTIERKMLKQYKHDAQTLPV